MHDAGLIVSRPKEKYHSYKGKVGKIADNIVARNFNTPEPLKKWTTDISQFNFSCGKCYISPVLEYEYKGNYERGTDTQEDFVLTHKIMKIKAKALIRYIILVRAL
ncbi:hypothetical protein [Streptococcus uberis]